LEQTGKKLASRVQTLTSGRKPLAVVVRDKDELARCDAERTEKRSELIARLQGSGPEKAQDARPEGEEDGVNGVGDESDEARCKGQLQPKLQPGAATLSHERRPLSKATGAVFAGPVWWPGPGSSRRPSAFQADARTNCATW